MLYNIKDPIGFVTKSGTRFFVCQDGYVYDTSRHIGDMADVYVVTRPHHIKRRMDFHAANGTMMPTKEIAHLEEIGAITKIDPRKAGEAELCYGQKMFVASETFQSLTSPFAAPIYGPAVD